MTIVTALPGKYQMDSLGWIRVTPDNNNDNNIWVSNGAKMGIEKGKRFEVYAVKTTTNIIWGQINQVTAADREKQQWVALCVNSTWKARWLAPLDVVSVPAPSLDGSILLFANSVTEFSAAVDKMERLLEAKFSGSS